MAVNAIDGVLKIAGALHISAAMELRQILVESLSQADELAVDLSEVEACDTAALQLLCAARQDARRLNKHLRFAGVPRAVEETVIAIGLPLQDPIPLASSVAGSSECPPIQRGRESAE